MRTFNHVGIVTTEQVEGAMFNEGLKVWLTDYSKSPNRIEFLKFEEGSCLPELVQKQGHIAYTVPSLEEELKGKKVITLITYLNKGGIYHVRHKDKIYK